MFLDEIGEMTPGLQAKLLRFLEEKTFKRVGGLTDIRVDVRVIAATNRNLEEDVKTGKFREDLFYRLQVMPIVLPPLRERHGDVAQLTRFYLARFNVEFKKRVTGLSPAAQELLDHYAWPGNVRELRNAIERAMLLADHDTLEPGDFTTLTRTVSPDPVQAPGRGSRSRGRGAPAAGAGARARRQQPDARGGTARAESRSGPLPDGEVRPPSGVSDQG